MTVRPPIDDKVWIKALLCLGVGLALVFVLFHESWASMARVWMGSVTYNHGFLILPISLFLIWHRRDELRHAVPRQEPWALLALAGFGLLWLVGTAGDIQLFQHIAGVGMAVGVTVALLGRYVCGVILFPLAFLFFMVPVGDALVWPLQDLTARSSVILLRAVDIPVFHDGILIETPTGRFEVAEACAGIRFLIANVVVATLFAYLAFRKWWKWAIFLTLAVIVPIVANSFRAFGIIYIAYHTDNEYAVGVDHLVYGWGFSVVVMFVVLLIGSMMADRRLGVFSASLGSMTAPAPWRHGFTVLPVVVILSVFAYAYLVMRPATPATFPTVPKIAANSVWEAVPTASSWRPRIVAADLTVDQSYRWNSETVDFFLAYYSYERQGAEVVNYAHSMADGEQWIRTASGQEPLTIAGLPPRVSRDRLQNGGDQRVVLWWYWVGGRFVAKPWEAKLLQIRERLFGRSSPAAILAVSTTVDDRLPNAIAIIEEFLSDGFAPQAYLMAFATPSIAR